MKLIDAKTFQKKIYIPQLDAINGLIVEAITHGKAEVFTPGTLSPQVERTLVDAGYLLSLNSDGTYIRIDPKKV